MSKNQTKPKATDRPEYKHGEPFEKLLGENLQALQQRVNDRKASLIIIDGGVGLGKTTLLVHCLDYINKLNGQGPIEMDGPQLAMGGVDFLKKLRRCFDEKIPCIGYDEAGDFSKRGSLTKFNAMLNRTFETFRAFKTVVIVVLPNFNVLDNQLFDNQIPRMLIHITDRSQKYGNFKVYDLMSMNWLRYWMKKSPIKDYAWQRVHPNFYGQFKDISPERSKELDYVTTTNKLKILRKSEVKIEGLLSYAELAQKVDRSVQWVKIAVSNLNIKHKRTVDRAKYFEPEVVNQLAELLENTAPPGRPRSKY